MSNDRTKTSDPRMPSPEERLKAAATILARGAIRVAAAELAAKNAASEIPRQLDAAGGSATEQGRDVNREDENA